MTATNFCQSEFREQETGRVVSGNLHGYRSERSRSSRVSPFLPRLSASQSGVSPRPCCALTPPTRLSSVAYNIHIPAAESLDSSHSFR